MNSPFRQWRFLHFAIFSCLLFVVLHIFFVKLPPCGNHVWRQSNTLAIAKNFHQENMNILLPRIDKRYDHTGVTGTNFPLYEWSLAAVYRVFGFHHFWHRLFALLISLLSFFLVYYFFKERGEVTGRVAAWAFLFNPLVFYYGFSGMPDVLSIAFAMVAKVGI